MENNKWMRWYPLPDRERVGTVWRTLDGKLVATLSSGEGINLPTLPASFEDERTET